MINKAYLEIIEKKISKKEQERREKLRQLRKGNIGFGGCRTVYNSFVEEGRVHGDAKSFTKFKRLRLLKQQD